VHGRAEGTWDADRLTQVVQNLVANALQHGDTRTPIEIELSAEDAWVELEVRNQGATIPPEVLPYIFDPFRQAQSAGRVSEGLGLGLYIAREIVQAHGGHLEVDSDEHRTRFCFRLPREVHASSHVD
jgi:signal transduction histidine kinase